MPFGSLVSAFLAGGLERLQLGGKSPSDLTMSFLHVTDMSIAAAGPLLIRAGYFTVGIGMIGQEPQIDLKIGHIGLDLLYGSHGKIPIFKG